MEVLSLKRQSKDRLIEEEMRASQFCPVEAYDDETELYFLNDDTIGFTFLCQPLTGGGQEQMEYLNQLVKQDYPPGTTMQFCLFKSPDIESELYRYKAIGDKTEDPLLKSFSRDRIKFLRKHVSKPIRNRTTRGGTYDIGLINNTQLIVSVKIPTSAGQSNLAGSVSGFWDSLTKFLQGEEKKENPSFIPVEDIERAKVWRDKIESFLTMTPLYPRRIKPEQYIRIMETMVNWSDNASWKNEVFGQWDQYRPIHDQIFDPNTPVVWSDHTSIKLGESCVVKPMSAKHFPKAVFFGEAMGFAGDMRQGLENIRTNYMVVANVAFGNIAEEKAKYLRKHQYTSNQVFGPILKMAPVLADKKHSLDILYDDFQEGNRPLLVSHHVVIFGHDQAHADEQAARAQSIWQTFNYTLMEDDSIPLAIFRNCLPLCTDYGAIEELRRYQALTNKECPVVLPVFGESKGTGTPHIELISRNGQLMSFSLHDSFNDKNCIIAAEAGSGKSFLTNAIISAYLRENAQIWVIDAGKSYQKLCDMFNGDFIQFGDDSKVCLNPFPMIENWDEDEDSVVSIVTAMVSPEDKGELTNLHISTLKALMKGLWEQKGKSMTFDDVAKVCLDDADPRIRDIGKQLYPYTSIGSYGRYFNGENNASFNNRFTVLELDELQSRKGLRQVVLLQLINQIYYNVYFGNRNRKKILIIDEAWDLLKSGVVAAFMEECYRKFRKYGASAIIVTQSLTDVGYSPTGMALMQNAATILMLGQKDETIEKVKNDNLLTMEPGLFNLLKTVRTIGGSHSEIFIKTEGTIAVGRLVVSPLENLIYTTLPEDVQALNDLHYKEGLSYTDAARRLLHERGIEGY